MNDTLFGSTARICVHAFNKSMPTKLEIYMPTSYTTRLRMSLRFELQFATVKEGVAAGIRAFCSYLLFKVLACCMLHDNRRFFVRSASTHYSYRHETRTWLAHGKLL